MDKWPMKICLATRHANDAFMPLALLYLKAHLVDSGLVAAGDVAIAEFPKEADSAEIAGGIIASEPDIVGLSCYVWNTKVLLDAARAIKAALPGTLIVLGGPEVGPVSETVLERHPCVDAIVRSEGEGPMRSLVGTLLDGGDLGEVAGITHRLGDTVVTNPNAPILRDLNELTSPHFAGYIDHHDRVICLETQRGCVFRCNFCFYNKDYSIRNRRFDLDRVKQEIRFWLDKDIREIYLMDPVFNLNAERTKDILRFIAAHNHHQTKFHTEVWAEFIDEEMAALFKAANIAFVEVGLQSSDEDVLHAVERRHRAQPFLDGIGHLKNQKLEFELQLIAGLPGDTRESFTRLLNFAASLDPPQLAVFGLMILPGTELWQKAEKLEIVFDPDPPYLVRSHHSMDRHDLEWVHETADVARLLWLSKSLRLVLRANRQLEYAAIVQEWIDLHPGQHRLTHLKQHLESFVEKLCSRYGIDPRFYCAAARLEASEEYVEPVR